tara:strand:- start:352 stop:930 length:579 start_codon:yes stop_codon:yes gene_type:complete
MNIREKLSKIQYEFKAKKSRFNSFGKYNFRSAEDILEALKPINKKYNVYFTVVEKLVYSGNGEFPILQTTASILDNESEEKEHAIALVGVDLAQKGMQMPQRFGAASSYGKKYALGNLLLIDDTADADATNTHNKTNVVSSKDFQKINNTKPIINKDNIGQAKKFLSNGGLMKTLQDKYEIEATTLEQLINE